MSEVTPTHAGDSAAQVLLFIARRARVLLIAIVLGAAVGLVLAFALRVVYRAEVKLVAVDPKMGDSMLTEMVGRLGGLADFAGLDIPGAGSDKNVTLEMLRSRSMARQFIQTTGIAGKILDQEPTPGEVPFRALRRFEKRIRSVIEDKRSGIITVAIKWHDPAEAARWANQYVEMFNANMRQKAAADAQTNLQYLERRLANTTDVGVREALYRLMEAELKSAMLADIRTEYAAKVIDPATTPDRRDFASPNRPVLVIGMAAAGVLLGMLYIVIVDVAARFKQARRSQE
jgi:uncharacterized protein involved in exopolysaccharide biosynthesis